MKMEKGGISEETRPRRRRIEIAMYIHTCVYYFLSMPGGSEVGS